MIAECNFCFKIFQRGSYDVIANEGGDAYRAQNNICQTEAKEPGTCRLGNRCDVSFNC